MIFIRNFYLSIKRYLQKNSNLKNKFVNDKNLKQNIVIKDFKE